MARIRSIHPGLYTDEGFMELSMTCRVLLPALWIHAWDDGVFEWRPKRLKAQIFPADNIDVEPLLTELQNLDFVRCFEINGQKYGAIKNFRKFQSPQRPNSSNLLPADLRDYVQVSYKSGTYSGNVKERSATCSGIGFQMEREKEKERKKESSSARAGGRVGTREASPVAVPVPEPSPPLPPNHPRVGAPPGAWLPIGDATELDDCGKTRAVVGGHYLDECAEHVCEAAKINTASWRGTWQPLMAWLRDGYTLADHILPAIRKCAQRPGYSPPATLAYFDRPIREAANAA